MPVSLNGMPEDEQYIPHKRFFGDFPKYQPLNRLSDNIGESMRLMAQIQALRKELPGIDCGSCGAPTCRAFAEDIVRGTAHQSECIIAYKEEFKKYIENYDRGDKVESE
jgi:ArsR family metal-binding transcriptional regulator